MPDDLLPSALTLKLNETKECDLFFKAHNTPDAVASLIDAVEAWVRARDDKRQAVIITWEDNDDEASVNVRGGVVGFLSKPELVTAALNALGKLLSD